jgi:hypothetical protein
MPKPIQITALTAKELAGLLSQTARRAIGPEVVQEIAEAAGIIAPDGTINLIEYTAFLVNEVSDGAH